MEMDAQPMKKEKKEYGKYDKYEVEGFVRTLIEAEEIKADPEKMKYAQMCASGQKKAIESIADIRSAAQDKADEEYDEA